MLSPAQKLRRLTGIGASEVAAVVGLSPWATPIDVWRAKIEGRDLEETPAMKRGRLLEPALADWYAEDTGAELRRSPMRRHAKHEFALCTPDRIARKAGDEWPVELKTAGIRMIDEWGEAGTDDVPQHYLVQVAWQLACTDYGRGDLAALIAGDDFRIYHLHRDAELEGMLIDKVGRFWRDYVETGREPPIDGSDSYSEYLAAKFRHQRGPMLKGTPEIDSLAQRLFAARAESEAVEAEEKTARQQLEQLIGEAEGVEGGWYRITWRTVKGRTKTDFEAVCTEAGVPNELIEKHTTIGAGYRRFLPTLKKGKK